MKLFRTGLLLLFFSLLFSCAGIPAGRYNKDIRTGSLYEYFAERECPGWEDAGKGISLFRFRDDRTGFAVDAAKIDLMYNGREIVVSRGIKPFVKTEKKTKNFRSKNITAFVAENNVLLAINANPFDPYRFFTGQKQSAVGVVISDGVVYSGESGYSALLFSRDNSAEIKEPPFSFPDRWVNGVGGFFTVLRGGKVVAGKSPGDTRSAAGKDRTGRYLFLSVVGGGGGVTFREAAEWMRFLGAWDALLLDGGGSSVLALKTVKPDRIKLLNDPDGGVLMFFKRLSPVFLGIK